MNQVKTAIIGAGIAGLACAKVLGENGISVTVFEKNPVPGGRMASRTTPEGLEFDHGAQYFTARDERFIKCVEAWEKEDVVSVWEGHISILLKGYIKEQEDKSIRYVGKPSMNSVCEHLAERLDTQTNIQVGQVAYKNESWILQDESSNQLGEFDYFITSAPSVQSAKLLSSVPTLHQQVSQLKMQPCWSVMLAFQGPLELPFDGAFVHCSPLSWIAGNSSKPDRLSKSDCWVLQASKQWSSKNIHETEAGVLPQMIEAFWQATRHDPVENVFSAAHLWRNAIPAEPRDELFLFDEETKSGACGDWCSSPRIEGAYLSGILLAEKIVSVL